MTEPSNQNNYPAPTDPTKGDYAVAAARAGYSAIPVVGGAAAELFGLIVTPPLEKRRQEWMKTIGEAVSRLEQAGYLKLEDLRNNDGFITTVMHASQAALRNHQAEKLGALRNAVLNSALSGAPDEALRQMFLNFVDQWTEWHIRILKLASDPPAWFRGKQQPVPEFGMGSNLRDLLFRAYPDLRQMGSFADLVWTDLYSRGMLNTQSIAGMMSGSSGVLANRATDTGNQFLRFIMEPKLPNL